MITSGEIDKHIIYPYIKILIYFVVQWRLENWCVPSKLVANHILTTFNKIHSSININLDYNKN